MLGIMMLGESRSEVEVELEHELWLCSLSVSSMSEHDRSSPLDTVEDEDEPQVLLPPGEARAEHSASPALQVLPPWWWWF